MTDVDARCLNCDAPLDGPYCSRCGQRAGDPDPTFLELIAEAWGEFVSVDGKFLSSLRLLLVRPGVLTAEYLRGQRVRHLPPLRLYLLCSVAYFLATSLVPDRAPTTTKVTVGKGDTIVIGGLTSVSDTLDRARRRDSVSRAMLRRHGVTVTDAPLDSALRSAADSLRGVERAEAVTWLPPPLRRRIARGTFHALRDRKSFSADFKQQMPRLMFVLMPAFGLLLALAYRSRHRRYPAHLIVSLHLHGFVFAMLTAGALSDFVRWDPIRSALRWAIGLWVMVYVPLALRRVYAGRLRWAVARGVLLAFAYALIGMTALSVLAVLLVALY